MQGEAIGSQLVRGQRKYVGFSSQLELGSAGPLSQRAEFHCELMAGERRKRSRVFQIGGNTQGQAAALNGQTSRFHQKKTKCNCVIVTQKESVTFSLA